MDLFCKQGKHQRAKQIGFALLLVCLMIPVFVVAIYNRPVADDYNYSMKVYQEIQENGVSLGGVLSSAMEMNWDFYNGWQGLYVSAFLLALQPGVFGEAFYGATTFLLVALIFGTFYLTSKWLLKELVTSAKYSAPLLALFLTFVVVQDMPSPLEGLYWYNGAVNYMPFCLMTFLNILLICKIHLCGSVRRENVLLAVSVLLSFLISGGNHVTSFLNLLAMLGLGVLSCLVKKYKVLLSFAAAAIGFYIMLIAPGTGRRTFDLAAEAGEFGVAESVALAMVQSVGMSIEWLNRGLFCLLLLLTPLLWRIVKDNRFGISFRLPLLPIAGSLLVMGAMWCLPYYAGGNFGTGRLYNVVWLTFVMLTTLCYTYLLGWFHQHFAPQIALPEAKKWQMQSVRVCLFGIGMAGILLTGNAYPQLETYGMIPSTSIVACFDLATGRAQGYAAQTDARIALYTDPEVDEVLVEPLTYYPSLLVFSDLGETPDTWPSIAISAYYDKPISLLPDETALETSEAEDVDADEAIE